MIKIYENIYVGDDQDYQALKSDESFCFVNAAKEPYHRQALGYRGVSCGKDNPEYLSCLRDNDNRLVLNLIDARTKDYIPFVVIKTALEFVDSKRLHKKVLINCNKGESRSATIGLLYLKTYTDIFDNMTYDEAKEQYKQGFYKMFNPAKGMDDFARDYWEVY